MRWMYARANPADNMILAIKLQIIKTQVSFKTWNIYNFFVTYET